MNKTLTILIIAGLSAWVANFVSAQVIIPMDDGFMVIPTAKKLENGVAYYNDFSTLSDGRRIDQFVAYRDPFVVSHTTGRSDHQSLGGINCSAPEETRPQTRAKPVAHVYHCLPMNNSDAGHQMAFAMDTSGYGFVGALPDQVFEDLTEVSVDINATNAGGRNFVEIKIVPADKVFVNGMPCVPDLPCNAGWDYDDIGAVGASTVRMRIATPTEPDGYRYSRYDSFDLENGDRQYNLCDPEVYCHNLQLHKDTTGIRERHQHIFRDNGDGTLSFGIEAKDGKFDWVQAPGSFPAGPLRVVIAFHNYTGTKSDNGPGFENNLSPSVGGFTWHWDELVVMAASATPSEEYFGGTNADRIVTPDNCIAFSQGQRLNSHHTNVGPLLHCDGDPDLDL
ncbi:MAG: hypothetical protein KTR16_10085 [Acidiferrobacterales bacterium]|nr:hypothetical protein [Acidiferrobacterales bacterium]